MILDPIKLEKTKDYLSAMLQYFKSKKKRKTYTHKKRSPKNEIKHTMTDTEFDLAIKQLNNEA
jgi:Na+/phosphate symporter